MRATGHLQNLQGNHACAMGAIAAGCRFFAGYPITPSSEIAEKMSLELPKVDGIFIQMEDEIASMGAILGASMGGSKAMTATSGPGFSLKQENIGYAAGAEIPCVVVNVMRGGPSTGLPTRPAQGDIMQARWGTHGDHGVIVLAPCSVKEIYQEMIRAFWLTETLRVPVVVIFDEVIGHLVETVELPSPESIEQAERKWASGPSAEFLPYQKTKDMVPAMAHPGDGYRAHTTGLTTSESGFPTQDPEQVEAMVTRRLGKLEHHAADIASFEEIDCKDAKVILVTVGISARAAARAQQQAREKGLKVGLFRPITLWPFPEAAFRAASKKATHIIVPEMNAGQLILEIERLMGPKQTAVGINRIDGEVIDPVAILEKIEEVI
ncbi:MAG: 2-oxoacid:acceptor oxidoreductase subunit alpha [Rhodospirillaceae bacterium]|jgi:2-oxoglutarate/2-oxoacid ferredoxin oxidoreductase subunit alpha|nr:2-oxoacid:acceptor oxidoreductase subunit alpha [Rhodospirillaceae bacterium]MBT5242741.1 2-oxoacid:acceptor oxidoreductase subunit alpha [Rhodospirillaceae bacterium]MBT5561554.1 2-oxoacid:acceptor oxidoreductase subunit alpha [Rhodospirillaceae bacterium]MBT6241848.1 2-oxoacid:acceptor oxidoreductase subunit alpha [Rhodospirillaceae bacterium]MBT7138649.1 2-oxoacid:acceptor oxidoreductase subunit alpha [Rhodospirillaceae bacterium]